MVENQRIDDDRQSFEWVIMKDGRLVKETELKNIEFLKKEPMEINCPSCEQDSMSVVRLEPVTCVQYLVNWTKLCKNWRGRTDINHYCGQCGCFIGRYREVCCFERCISNAARQKAADDEMTLKTKPKCCAERIHQAFDRFKTKRAQRKTEKANKSDKSGKSAVVTVEVVDESS